MDTSFTMFTHAVHALSLGSLLYATKCSIGIHAHMQGLAVRDMRLIFNAGKSFLLHFSPRKRILHCFQEQLFFLGSLLFNAVAHNTSPMKVEAGVGIAKGCCVGAGLWRRQLSLWCYGGLPVLYHAQGTKPGRLMGKEGYHQRMHLISIKMTSFPN